MAKTKKTAKSRDIPKLPAESKPAPAKSHALRETVESIVIAFVLAFLFRVFEAEAFVIPTGSMAPTLMGRHKDVECPKCDYRYQVSASEENPDNPQGAPSLCLAGMCPMCQYVLPMVPASQLPLSVPERRLAGDARKTSYNGDRILVNKYIYTFSEPQRWDVVVFKFPGDAKMNYIKRLVGLPGETLRIYHGDIFVGERKASRPEDFDIERKPPEKVLAMRQLVHDTNHDPAELELAGWPLRWQVPGSGGAGWKVEKEIEGNNVRQRYGVDAPEDDVAWLRYKHFLPDYDVWQYLATADRRAKGVPQLPERLLPEPRLITDANPYNAREDWERWQYSGRNTLEIEPAKLGLHWVGDLMVAADVEVKEANGELLLDLVEGGRHFTCRIDLATGKARLTAGSAKAFEASAATPLNSPGRFHLEFANIDDQLLLWIDGELIPFERGTAYDVAQVFGDRSDIRPATGKADEGDFAPVGIGARGAKIEVDRLQVWRDIYYIADDSQRHTGQEPVSDFPHPLRDYVKPLPTTPSLWDHFTERRDAVFPLKEDQFFVMGDNSAESSDARLWDVPSKYGGHPGGQYLERRLLIGKALCVYWPHSWHRIPGTPIPFPLFPNFSDMRLVR